MSDVINLKRARKQRERDNKGKQSAVKRVQFGTSKKDHDVVAFERTKIDKKLDEHKRENSDTDND